MRVSVVICTYNRATGLRETLECLRHQNYDEFEVVVVNGPSTDDTARVLESYGSDIRAVTCAQPNLSMSRNIGIRAAAGEIVAFIDDDALPEFDWLNQALPSFADPEVAGCGGIVFDHTGTVLQYRYSAMNRFGDASWTWEHPYDELSVPGAFTFPYLQGTNALFRRSVLEQVGGFDEVFEYYLDEADVCCRIIDHGYVLRQLANSPVHHKFLPSNIRDHKRVINNWFPLVKNHTYFGFRHASDDLGVEAVMERSRAWAQTRVDDAALHESTGDLPRGSANRARKICDDALTAGAELGRARHALDLGPVKWPSPEFSPYPTITSDCRRRYVLVSSGYDENMTGGVARYTTDLAGELARQGQDVRVITRSALHSTVDLEAGVWVHRLDVQPAGGRGVAPEMSESINDFTTAVVDEIQRIQEWSKTDVVYGALWDVELLGVLRRSALPTMVHLVTPAAIALDQAGVMGADVSGFVEALTQLEREVMIDSDLVHANGSAIVHSIRHHYGATFDSRRCQVVPLGLRDQSAEPAAPIEGTTLSVNGGGPSVLFVGRLEARKGIDLFFDVIAGLAPEFPEVRWIVAGADTPLTPGGPLAGVDFRARHAGERWLANVQFTGQTSDTTLHGLYGSADLAVLPSRYESFGLVMVEAMMHGTPLVSCAVGGIVDVVRDGTDGILVPPDDAVALTDAVRQLLADPAKRGALGKAGRRRFEETFAIEAATRRFRRAAERLEQRSIRDAPWCTVQITPPTAATLARRHPMTLAADDTIVATPPEGGRWRLPLLARDDTILAVTTSTASAIRSVKARNGVRLELEPGSTTKVHVVAGTVEAGSLIHLLGESP